MPVPPLDQLARKEVDTDKLFKFLEEQKFPSIVKQYQKLLKTAQRVQKAKAKVAKT